MPKVRKGAADRWSRRAAAAAQDYSAGIADPRADWADAAIAAKPAYNAGLAASQARDGWAKGIAKRGSTKWRDRALKVGPGRFSEGVGTGQGDYQAGVQPYLDTLANLQLPARGAKGDPKNLLRVQAVDVALHQQKLQSAGK